MRSIYLDNNATTAIDPDIVLRMHELYGDSPVNPASQHRPGRTALRILEAAKNDLIQTVDAVSTGMSAARVILTSGGTEAKNLAVLGRAAAKPGRIVVASTEHPSVTESAIQSAVFGCKVSTLNVDSCGRVQVDHLQQILSEYGDSISVVSVMLGNNETGVVQDIASICRLCNSFGVPVHSDVVQALGKIPFSMQSSGLSAITLTGHKIHGPVGIGALIVNPDFAFSPLFFGGGQQLGIRPGTEPVVPADALAMSVKATCTSRLAGVYDDIEKLRDWFESEIVAACEAVVIAAAAPRLPHTSNLAFPGADRQALHMALDLAGLACSTGSACASGSSRPSPVLTAMGIPDNVAIGSLRFSLSRFTVRSDVEKAVEIIKHTVAKCRR